MYRFDSSRELDLQYALERIAHQPGDARSLRVIQRLEGPATLIEAERKWAGNVLTTLASTCALTSAVTNACDNTVTASPFSGGSAVGGSFTSQSNTSASQTISVTFAKAVRSVTVTIYDADFGGNQAVATGGSSATFSFDNQPGNGGVVETQTLVASGAGITAVQLIPAPADYVAYDLSWEPNDDIKVECLPNAVTRGQQVTCTASPKDPAASLTVTDWRFDSPDLTGPVTEQSTSLTWAGTAVASGTVTVQGSVNGTTASGKGNIVVSARSWSASSGDTVSYSETELGQQQDILPDHPTRYSNLGNHAALADAYLPSNGYTQISSGPNREVLFFTKVPVQAISQISINRIAMAVASDFYNLQGTKPKNQPGSPLPYCVRADVPAFLPKAINHEGLGSPPPSGSHAAVFRAELNQRTPLAVEGVVALRDITELLTKASAAAQPAISTARQIAADQDNGGTVAPIPVSCNFRFFTP